MTLPPIFHRPCVWGLIGLSFLTASYRAYAVPTLSLFDSFSGITKLVVDEGAGDTNPGQPGVVGFNGIVGVWTVNTSTGLVDGTSESPFLDLNSINKSTAAATLTIKFSVDGFGPSAGVINASFGGTLAKKNGVGSAISFATLWSPANTLFSGGALTNFTFVNSSSSTRAFSDNQELPFIGGTPYSLTEVVTITHGTGEKISSFDAALEVISVPDGGSTLLILGSASLGVFGFRRKMSCT